MANFITEFTLMDGQGAEKTLQWNIYMDGSSNRQARRAGIVLFSPEQDRIECMVRLEFHTTNNEAEYVMKDVHGGIYGNHSGARSLVHKLIRARYYWPTMQRDAEAYVKTCDKCQRFSNTIRQPSEELTPMTAPWPFSQWGLDIVGPFPTAVGINYFTKWVEAKALPTIMEKNIRNFVWKNIICNYGIPRVLVSDNRKQFDNNVFKDFYLELGIQTHYSSPAHP